MAQPTPITVAKGDGIGPEIMDATLHVLKEAGAHITIEEVEIGEKVYLAGHPTGMGKGTWESIEKTKVFLKAPITTPQGGGYRSLNVTVRGMLGLYANVRPCISYSPFIFTKHPEMDLVVIRENEEDLYIGQEYQQTPDAVHALKLNTRAGCERICRYAFEYAKQYNRKKVTCFTKDNILKLSDGLFHKIFLETAKHYPDIENEHWIVDIGAAKVAATPEQFDVIVMPNLYGDIISDISALITGSVGLVGTANIGEKGAMFEAIHGSAPTRAGQNVANPSGLMLASVLMMVHIGQPDIATRIHNAWLKTVEEGIHTGDIFTDSHSKQKVGTKEFAVEVAKRLGQIPETLKAAHYEKSDKKGEWVHHKVSVTECSRKCVGVDLVVYHRGTLAELLEKLPKDHQTLTLTSIANRGIKVWPQTLPDPFCIEQWRCRFLSDSPLEAKAILKLYKALVENGLDIVQTENLYEHGGERTFSK
jgi:isocitrate dehydrogenase